VKALTLKALYATMTRDRTAHQRRIDAHFRKLDKRRQLFIRSKLLGASYSQIGASAGITAGSAQSAVRSGLERIRKAIAGEARYNRVGRGPVYPVLDPSVRTPAERLAAKQGAPPAVAASRRTPQPG
jgi:hypothetical protein